MIPAWYMKFIPGHHGSLDRVGGLPTHLPPIWPVNWEGKPLRFEAQFHCDGIRLKMDDAFLLQIYRDDPDIGDVRPVVILVPRNAELNVETTGTPDTDAIPHDIAWEYRADPDESNSDLLELAASKLWGCCYFSRALKDGERLLLFLDEEPVGFNFGGDELMLAIDTIGKIRWAGA